MMPLNASANGASRPLCGPPGVNEAAPAVVAPAASGLGVRTALYVLGLFRWPPQGLWVRTCCGSCELLPVPSLRHV